MKILIKSIKSLSLTQTVMAGHSTWQSCLYLITPTVSRCISRVPRSIQGATTDSHGVSNVLSAAYPSFSVLGLTQG